MELVDPRTGNVVLKETTKMVGKKETLIQERLTKDVVDEVEKAIQPKGIALILKARHLCKEMRGVKKINGEMVTSDLRGLFREKEARMEFMELIKNE